MRYLVIPILAVLSLRAAWSDESATLVAHARSIVGPGQGVYVESSDGTVLVAQAADVAVHPASVSKVPTTLTLLRKLGPDHRFVTTFAGSGRVLQGTLYGDLLVESDGDPSLVDEDALLVAEKLKTLGIHAVAGNLRLRAPLTFNWQTDEEGNALRRSLAGQTPPAAWQAVRELETASHPSLAAADGMSSPGIRFIAAGALPALPSAGTRVVELTPGQPLVVYRSQPLVPLLKSLNDYSNNIFKPLADAAGGAAAVERLARSVVPTAMAGEIVLGDGAGTDPSNRLSPRAAVKLLRALEEELGRTGHMLFDILPVAGVDPGTLHDRLNGATEAGRVVGKTGTFGDYGASALIGAIPTTDRGTVYFAILNHNVPVPQARARQDRFVRALLANLSTVRWNYERDLRPAVARADVTLAPR